MIKGFRIDRNDGRIYAIGVTVASGGVHFSLASEGETCAIVFYKKGARSPKRKIGSPANIKTGDVWNMTVLGSLSSLGYVYEVDGQQVPDPYGRGFTGTERWGNPMRLDKPIRIPVDTEGSTYDWEEDALPCIPCDQCVIYRIYPRGFTRRVSPDVEGDSRGTFKGAAKKIPYPEDLGITTVETMPPVEFEELIIPERVDGNPFAAGELDGKLNCRGHTRGYCSAPEYVYGNGPMRQPERELKDMMKALHKAGPELVLELSFGGKEAPSYVLDMVRFWAQECHVDGVRLVGYAPVKFLGKDPYLSRLKPLAPGWDGVEPRQVKHLAKHNDGLMVDIRSFLEGGEDQLSCLVYHIRRNPQQMGVINYMANINGFALMDMVSYNMKHDEASREDSRGGANYNQSWNCGAEGPSRKKRIMQTRRKQIYNALLMLLLSQGAPLLAMGDEFSRIEKENNNSYCQDSDMSWLNWSLLNPNNSIHKFVKHVIRPRKEHSVFHMEKELALVDYRCVGLPDVSYHGPKT